MSFTKFFKSLTPTSPGPLASGRRRSKCGMSGRSWCRPLLEELEDRTLLNFTPADFAHFGQKLEDGLVALQTPLNTLLAAGSRVPLIGNRLQDAAALKVFADPMLKNISEQIAAVAPSSSDINNGSALRSALFGILGPAGTNLIANINNLAVTTNSSNNTIQVRMPFSKSLPNLALGGGFGLGLAGLPFNVTASGGVSVGVTFIQTAQFSFSAPTNTASAVTGPFDISATATLVKGSNIEATVGFLKSTLTDNGTVIQAAFRGEGSSFQVTFNAKVNLLAKATFGGNTQFPSLGANFILNWDTRANVNATPQSVRFNNVSVSLGEFLTNLIRPVVEKVQIVTSPLQPILDFLKEPVPGVSDLAEAAGLGSVTVKDVIVAYGKSKQQSDEMNKNLEMYLKLADIIDQINALHVANPNLMIDVGDLDLTGDGNTLVNGGILREKLEGTAKDWQQALDSLGGVGTQIKNLLKNAEDNVRLTFPLIQKPKEGAFKLFVGQHADLVILDLKYKLDSPAPSEGGSIYGVAFGFNGGLNIDAALRLGYDTYGIEKFVKSGKPADLADGFYLGDATHFTLSGGFGVYAGAGIVVFSVSMSGGLVIPKDDPLKVTLNLGDPGNQPDHDLAKLHFDEVRANSARLFHTSGKLEASISITVTIGIKVDTPLGEVFIGYTKEFEIASVTIIDFASEGKQWLGIGGGGDGQPQLATLKDGDLTLHMGSNANKLPLDVEVPVSGNEHFFVLQVLGKVIVSAYGLVQVFPASAVTTIVADGGSGDDVIIIDKSVSKNVFLHGGTGKDRLQHYGSGSDVQLYGDEESDVLVGGDNKEVMYGGPDNDELIGGGGGNNLFGHEGVDKLFGGADDELLDGGPGNDEIDSGGGRDLASGGLGDDTFTIYPGIGSPILYGASLLSTDHFDGSGFHDKLIVLGSPGADRFELTKIDNTNIRIGFGAANIAGPGFPNNPVANAIEEIFIAPRVPLRIDRDRLPVWGTGADQVTVNDLSGTVVTKVVVNEKEFFNQDKEADTVIVNGRASNDTVKINQTYSQIIGLRFATAQSVTGIGPEIWTPNALRDKLIVNTLGGNDQITVTSDPQPVGIILDPGTVEVDAGEGADTVAVGSISSATNVRGGNGDDTMGVGALLFGGGSVDRIYEPLYLDGGSGSDTFRFDDTLSTTAKTGAIGGIRALSFGPPSPTQVIRYLNSISGFGMGAPVTFDSMDFVTASLGSGGNLVNIESTPAADQTRSINVSTGRGADIVNVKRMSTAVSVFGESGLDTVNVGLNGSVQNILGVLTVMNDLSYSAVNVDDSAGTDARTVILYNSGPSTVISGLAPGGDINLGRPDLRSLTIRAGKKGNTFRIHDTLPAFFEDGAGFHPTLTSVSTGAGPDSVTIDGATGALALDVQGAPQGANLITVGTPTASLNAISGRIDITGGTGALNDLTINDAASSVSRDYVIGGNFAQRLDKARIGYENMSSLTLRAGAQTDHIVVQDTMPTRPGQSTTIAQSGGNDGIDVSKTTGSLVINAGASSVINVGDALNPLDNIQGPIGVVPSGAGNFVTLRLNDQAATTPEWLDVTPAILGTSFKRSGAADIQVLVSPLGNFQWQGGSGGNTVNVKAQPAAESIFMLGAGDDVFNDGAAANTLVAGALDTGTLTVIGGAGTDQLLIRDQGTTTARRYELGVGQFVGQESRGGISARPLNSLSNSQTVIFDQVESVTLNAGSGGNLFKVTGSPAATSMLINTGASNDTVDVGSGNNPVFGPSNQLRDFRGPLKLDGQGGQDQLTFNDQGTTTGENYTLESDQLTRSDANSVADMSLLSFMAFKTVTLNGSRGGSTVFVQSTAAGTSTTAYGQPGALYDTFTVGFGADTNGILGPVNFFGQAADGDFAYYYDYFNPNPQTYNVSTDPLLPQALLVKRTGSAPVTFNDLNQVIFHSPLVGGSTVDIKGLPAQTFLNMLAGNGDTVTLGSRAPNLDGTLANIKGPVAVASYSPDDALTLLLDDSGNADQTPKNIYFTQLSPFDIIEGFAPNTVEWNLGANASIALLGGAADETFALASSPFASAISIDGGGGVNTLDYSGYAGSASIPGLVSWYKGEADFTDAVSGNDGVPQNGVTFAQGKVGQAFSFDGADDFVEIADNPNQTPSSITLEAWVNPDTVDGFNAIMSKYQSSDPGPDNVSWFLGNIGGRIEFGVYQSGNGPVIDTDDAVLTPGVWQHVAGTFDVAAQTFKIYLNGVEVPSSFVPGNEGSVTGIGDSTSPVRIGALVNVDGVTTGFWDGLIDEPSIYNRALSVSEIQGIFTAGSAVNATEKGNLAAGGAGKSTEASNGVEVNLQLGTATGLGGGIANIQNVIGSAGNDILVGNGGNVLSGGLGRDLLIAGASDSILNGGGGEDILIGGGTDYDQNTVPLRAIMAEWTSDSDYASRVANLNNGTNGAPILNAATVRSNRAGNTLNGNAGLDFFFANLARDTLDSDPLTEALVEV